MTTSTYRVSGLRCDHCVQSVTAELTKIEGVTDVQVALEGGETLDGTEREAEVTVQSEQPLHDQSVHEAVSEAGYKMAT